MYGLFFNNREINISKGLSYISFLVEITRYISNWNVLLFVDSVIFPFLIQTKSFPLSKTDFILQNDHDLHVSYSLIFIVEIFY